jgi:hypothetical protein
VSAPKQANSVAKVLEPAQTYSVMHVSATRLRAAGSALLLVLVAPARHLASQGLTYHMELSNQPAGHSRVILVNDSAMRIEAYHASQRCRVAGGFASGDVLDTPAVRSSIHGASGKRSSGDSVEPGGRWETAMFVMTATSRDGVERCEAHIDAVIFDDGSYEGSELWVQGLKARRDGIAARVSSWSEELQREHPEDVRLEALLAEAKGLVAEDHARLNNSVSKEDSAEMLRQYWSGWLQVDMNVESLLSSIAGEAAPDAGFRRVSDFVARWKRKIDGNVALSKLELLFPAPPERASVN